MVEALQSSDGGGFNISAWITAFYRRLTRIYTPEQDGDANPEIVYIVGGLIKGEI